MRHDPDTRRFVAALVFFSACVALAVTATAIGLYH
jgi:hypothetical protein